MSRQKLEKPTKITSPKDLINLKPMTNPQRRLMESYLNSEQNIIAMGSAGTGKTLCAIYLALNDVLGESSINHLKIIRSPVASKDQGHLPGTLEEKQMYYELPYQDITGFITGKPSAYEYMKKHSIIDFVTTSYIRGLTWNDAVIVVDECQNMMFHELNTIITRVGKNCRIIFIGDMLQCDLFKKHETSGWNDFINIAEMMNEIDLIEFTKHDIVRSKFVKSWMHASEEYTKRNTK